MQKIYRAELPPETDRYLKHRLNVIDRAAAPTRKDLASHLWTQFRGGHRLAVRKVLSQMASGLERCMYCEDSLGTDIDHFDPKSRNPTRAFDWSNLFLACSHCNSNAKRTQFPLDSQSGEALLIDPTSDDPLDHLLLAPTTGEYKAMGPKGQPSIDVFDLNRFSCTEGRRNSWIVTCELCKAYASSRDSEEDETAENILDALRNQPFQGIRSFIAKTINGGTAGNLIPQDTVRAFERFPELLSISSEPVDPI